MKLEEFGVNGSDAANMCYLRNLGDAQRLGNVMRSCPGGNAVVVGGGYIGMECAAALSLNELKVTMVFPDAHFLSRLFFLFNSVTLTYLHFAHFSIQIMPFTESPRILLQHIELVSPAPPNA